MMSLSLSVRNSPSFQSPRPPALLKFPRSPTSLVRATTWFSGGSDTRNPLTPARIGYRHLRVLMARRARNADRADDLAADNDRNAAIREAGAEGEHAQPHAPTGERLGRPAT